MCVFLLACCQEYQPVACLFIHGLEANLRFMVFTIMTKMNPLTCSISLPRSKNTDQYMFGASLPPSRDFLQDRTRSTVSEEVAREGQKMPIQWSTEKQEADRKIAE